MAFPYLKIDDKKQNIRYLGYELKLTPCEYEIICLLLRAENGLTKAEIAERSGAEGRLRESSIPVHVCAVNKKSRRLGGRNLIENGEKKGYFINKCL